jgi:hypothetical protein
MKILDENYMAANKPLPLGAVYFSSLSQTPALDRAREKSKGTMFLIHVQMDEI